METSSCSCCCSLMSPIKKLQAAEQKQTPDKEALLSYLLAFLLAMGGFSSACFLFRFFAHVENLLLVGSSAHSW